MKIRWVMLLTVLLLSAGATAQNTTNSSFQIKGVLLDSLTQEGEPLCNNQDCKERSTGTSCQDAGNGYERTVSGESAR